VLDKTTKVKFSEPRQHGGAPVEHCIRRRRSVRGFRDRTLTEHELGQLLWAAQGITATDGKRAVASAGALYPLELYVVSGNVGVGICEQITRVRRPGDIVVVSIHWGPNWGYEIWDDQVRFARALIDRADVTVVQGHSSHHAKAIEVYGNRLILYGCGDFLNDYEGISGYEEFRDDLALMYFADIDRRSRELVGLAIVPLQIRQFRLMRASPQDVAWLQRTLDRDCQTYATRVALAPEGRLALSWPGVEN
jgi:hypothetical protein